MTSDELWATEFGMATLETDVSTSTLQSGVLTSEIEFDG
jgi:hypothetical protein